MHSVQYVSVYVSRSVCQLACYQFFSETAHRIFQKILREVRRSKRQKLRQRNFQENSDFEEKTKKVIQNSFFCLVFVKKLIDVFTLKVVHSNFLYDCTKNQKMSPKNLLQLWPKMLSAQQVAFTFDHEYLWKKSINILGFLNRDSHQREIASEITTFGCVRPVVPLFQSDCWIL